MPPTFPFVLAFMLYIYITAISSIIFAPMLLIRSKKVLAKKVLIAILISFPCLISVAILLVILALLPSLLFFWLINTGFIGQKTGEILTVAGLFLFIGLVASSALYVWYILSKITYQIINNKPVIDFIKTTKVYKLLQPRLNLKEDFLQKNGIIKIVLTLLGIPLIMLVFMSVYYSLSNLVFTKPSQADLVGKYHISEATVANFDKSTYRNYQLEFWKDSTFLLSTTPNIDVCNKGKYEVDYQFDYNELTLRCNNSGTSAHIDRHYNYYRIEFVIGDPDSGESIYFEKDN